MKSGTGAPTTATADREETTEQRMPTNEIMFRDEEEERELKKLTLTQMECRCSRRR